MTKDLEKDYNFQADQADQIVFVLKAKILEINIIIEQKYLHNVRPIIMIEKTMIPMSVIVLLIIYSVLGLTFKLIQVFFTAKIHKSE